jgi:hypothetical protein
VLFWISIVTSVPQTLRLLAFTLPLARNSVGDDDVYAFSASCSGWPSTSLNQPLAQSRACCARVERARAVVATAACSLPSSSPSVPSIPAG